MAIDTVEEEDNFWVGKRPRTIVTLPLLLLLLVNPIYHFGMMFLIEIDLFIGNFLAWLFFGEVIAGGIGFFALLLSSLPIMILPSLWHWHRLWGVVKIPLFILVVGVSTILSSLVSIGAIWLLDVFATPRLTLWWGGLWGVISEAP